jgi:plasmid replication initiation protein
MEIIDIKKNKIVKKHNSLIKAKGNLSGTAQKMLAMLISMIREDDSDFQKYALHIDTYKKEIDATNKEKEFYISKSLELMQNPFYIEENGKRTFLNWCSTVQPDEKEGYIIFKIDPTLKPFLLNLKKNFSRYHICNILHLKGKYSPRIYEFFISNWNQQTYYDNEIKKVIFSIDLEELKDTLGIPKSYRYNNLKEQVIEKAKTDFSKYTDISFLYKEIKTGKKVTKLEITLSKNNQGSNNFLKDIQTFIYYMRKNFINYDILNSKDKHSKKRMLISINPEGKIYDKLSTKKLNKERSQEIWQGLYSLAKSDKLACLTENSI